MRNFKFYKESNNQWYVDLPEWGGSKEDLQMVAGADLFLDILAQGQNTVDVILSDTYFNNCEVLEMKYLGRIECWELGEGAWYELKTYMGIEYRLDMWLCDVTKFVFKDFPRKIFFK